MYPPCFAMPISVSESVYISMSALFVSLPPAFRARKKGRDFMRKFKTAEKNRTNYVYYTAEGKAITIKPGMVGNDKKPASEEMITLLHNWDDDQVDADRRELYHCPVHYQAYADGESKDADDRNSYLADADADPLEQVLSSIEEQEHSEMLDRLKAVLPTLTDLQKSTIYKKFWLNQTNVQIAAEEGITEAAVRNRLKKIYASLAKKI